MDFKPLGSRVVVLANAEMKNTKTGLILLLPDKVVAGTIMAVGPGKKGEDPMTVKVGDDVIYGDNAGTPLEIDGVKYLIMRQATIYGIL